MRALFPNFPDAIENTAKIAARCNVEFDFSTTHLPKFPLPEGETDALAYLRALCEKGLRERYGEGREDARERMEYELGVISGMGYVDYFLIVWDFIHYARTHGVGVGPGRVSGGGSIVAYCLGITSDVYKRQRLAGRRARHHRRVPRRPGGAHGQAPR